MWISTTPWEDRADLGAGTRRAEEGGSPTLLDSRADLGSPASDLPLDAGNSEFLRGGGARRGGEMVRGGEKRHFFPLTSLQIGYVFRRIFSPVLGISCAVDARLTAM